MTKVGNPQPQRSEDGFASTDDAKGCERFCEKFGSRCALTALLAVSDKGGDTGGVVQGERIAQMPSEQTKAPLAVTDKQARLVDTLVATGCSITEAAREAGYASGESGRVTASKALRLPHVQQYMMQRVSDALGLNATVAAAKLLQLARGAKSEYVQLEASKDILDRAGYKAPERHMHLHAGNISVQIDLT